MNLPTKKALFFFFTICLSGIIIGQTSPEKSSKFNKYKAFNPLFMENQANAYHSATGNPGKDYWQNRADYKIEATLDTLHKKLDGVVNITYTNNSPYNLHFLWLQMDQNTFRKDARSTSLFPDNDRNGVQYHTKGYVVKSVLINGNKANYLVDDTRMQIRLKEPLKKDGKKIKITIAYSFEIPFHGKDRMGKVKTKNGWIYTLAQWYPRMAVYDEVEGWNNLPYLGAGEFYLEYGSFDYSVTVPANMLVAGSGVLQNPGSVLTKKEQDRLKKARESDSTITILSKKEMLAGTEHQKGKDGMLTWHFKMDNSHDVAWTASKAFIWDAARINLPDGKKALAQSVYPEENSGQDGYARSTEYTKRCIEIYSNDWFPYPYKVATNVGAHELGMEYPGIVFCSYKSKESDLWGVINHEFGHTWFPMIVGSNERKYAWMDEGFNTFINDFSTKKFNNGEYYSPTDFQGLGAAIFGKDLDPVFTRPDVIHNQNNIGIEAYYKPSAALNVLRNVVLGKKRFDFAFKTYINRWKFKHPQPWDFFNTMSNASGEDLGWFFRSWFMNNWTNDQGVESIKYVDDAPANGSEITLVNEGEIPMPVILKITFEDQSTKSVKLPVEIWMTGPKYIYHLDSKTKISSVEIDPEHLVPDANILNNIYIKLDPAPKGVSADSVIQQYFTAIGGLNKLKAIKDIAIERIANVHGIEITVQEKIKKPGKYLQDVLVGGNSLLKFVANGDSAYVYQRGVKQAISDDDVQFVKAKKDAIFPELVLHQKGNQLSLLGIQNSNGKSFYVIQVTDTAGNVMKSYFDTKTGYKMKQVDQMGNTTYYSDYKEYDGIFLPSKTTTDMFGGNVDLSIKNASINKGIDDSEFQ